MLFSAVAGGTLAFAPPEQLQFIIDQKKRSDAQLSMFDSSYESFVDFSALAGPSVPEPFCAKQADIWSVAVTLFTAATGDFSFDSEDESFYDRVPSLSTASNPKTFHLTF